MKTELLPMSRLRPLIRLGKRLGLSTLLWLSIPASMVKAQVVPDGSLESAVQQIQELMKINGGQRAGNNLFHSFEEFSIPAGMEATFENATDIENIFTRVTGDSVSAIDGILSTQGGANLFLMNPNGIVFGTDASIDVGGSFIATTADSIQFSDGNEFAASDTESDALINVGFPVAFGFNEEPSGSITVNGTGSQVSQTSSSDFSISGAGEGAAGLSVIPGKNLALIGGKVNLQGGTITASEGQIFVGSVDSGSVTLQSNAQQWNFSYEKVFGFEDIKLSEKALIDTSGQSNGSIEIHGANIELTDGSLVLIQNQGNTSSGEISVNADGSLIATGVASDQSLLPSSFRTETLGEGKAGDLIFSATNLLLEERGGINTLTYGSGDSGNLNIDVSKSLQLTGNPTQAFNTGRITSITLGSGKAGNLQISTEQLEANNGAEISTSSLGEGEGGDLKIDAKKIELTGVDLNTKLPTAIRAGAFNVGYAGSISINTSSLKLTDGAAVNTTAFSEGAAGNVIINATNFIEVSGKNTELNLSSSIDSSATVSGSEQNPFGVSRELTGSSGNVTVNTKELNLSSDGSLSAINEGSGDAGSLSINAENVNLDSKAAIAATSASGTSGNIELEANSLRIDNSSTITATAENEGGGGNITINASNISAKKNSAISANAAGGNGGNITIETDTLLGLDNSDITANAINGDGGNISIAVDAIVGFEQRARLSPLSDITASSDFGTSGVININTPESSADEKVEVAAREVNSNDITKEFAQSCRQGRGQFTYTAVGVPESPDRYFDDSGEYGTEEVSNLPTRSSKYPPLGQPQSEAHRRELTRTRRNRLKPEQSKQPGTEQSSKRKVQGQIVIEDLDPSTGKGYPVIYAQTNAVPPRLNAWRKPGAPREEANAIQVNPNGEHYMVRIAEIEHPEQQVCTTMDSSSANK